MRADRLVYNLRLALAVLVAHRYFDFLTSRNGRPTTLIGAQITAALNEEGRRHIPWIFEGRSPRRQRMQRYFRLNCIFVRRIVVEVIIFKRV